MTETQRRKPRLPFILSPVKAVSQASWLYPLKVAIEAIQAQDAPLLTIISSGHLLFLLPLIPVASPPSPPSSERSSVGIHSHKSFHMDISTSGTAGLIPTIGHTLSYYRWHSLPSSMVSSPGSMEPS